jgi:tetratricopeptide (TPR) repeat protein
MQCPACGQRHARSGLCAGATVARPQAAAEANGPFVGRVREFGELVAGLDAAISGRGRLFLLVGEAGIGKTRLADELSATARDAGALVLWARCWEGGGAPASWLWTQIVRGYARERDLATLVPVLGPATSHLAQFVPDLVEGPPAPAATPASHDHARFALFDATTTFLKAVAQAQPLVLVLDDLHAGDEASLLLLQFLARELRDTAILVIGTYRDAEARRIPPVEAVLGALAREGHHLRLSGLSSADVAAFLEQAAGRMPAPALARAVHEATDGNPFYVEELGRLLAAEGRLDDEVTASGLGIPVGVRATIRRRLEPLPDPVARVLSVAAVVGREFDAACLEIVCDLEAEPLLLALGEAVSAGLLTEVGERPGRFSFAHALVRETLYDDLSPVERRRLHRVVAHALEGLHRTNLDPHVGLLAHHFFFAGGDSADKAIEYSLRAAARSTRLLGYEEAVAHCLRALQAADVAGIGGVRRCELLLALGDAQARAGDNVSGRETYELAAELARQLGHAHYLARSAVGSGGTVPAPTGGMYDVELVSLLREARDALGPQDSPARVHVLGRLAMELYYAAPREERDALSQEAIEIARRLGDDALLAGALNARCFALWGLEDSEERIAIASEIVRHAEQAGDHRLALEGRTWRVLAFLELGDIAAADTELKAHARLAEDLREPYHLWEAKVFEAARALLDGAFDEARTVAREALHIGQRQQDPTLTLSLGPAASLAHSVQEFQLARERNTLDEHESRVLGYVQQYPSLKVWRCALAFVYAESGKHAEARRELARIDVAHLPQDGNWLVALANLADVCGVVEDVERAHELYALLEPYDGRHIVIGRLYACRGAVAHYLGVLAATMGRYDDAERHFADAESMYERMGARPFLAKSRLEHGRALVRAGADPARARDLLERAQRAFADLGVPVGAAQAGTLLAELAPSTGPAPSRELERAPERATAAASVNGTSARFRREGEYWTVGIEPTYVRIKDAKGLRYLALLIARPDDEIHVLDLVGSESHDRVRVASAAAAEAALTGWGLGDAGAVLDAQAKAAYQRRLRELREDLDEAREFADVARAEQIEAEIDFLVHELAAGVGLGGRDRKAASPAERARVSVTKAIKTAMRRIGENHPDLGRHLDQSVRTGTFCSYSPSGRSSLTWSA